MLYDYSRSQVFVMLHSISFLYLFNVFRDFPGDGDNIIFTIQFS